MTPTAGGLQKGDELDVRQIALGMALREFDAGQHGIPVPNIPVFNAVYDVTHYDLPRATPLPLHDDWIEAEGWTLPPPFAEDRRRPMPATASTPLDAIRRYSSRETGATPPARRRAKTLQLSKRQARQVQETRLRLGDSSVRAAAYDRFQLLRQWEGYVLDRESTQFRGAVVTTDTLGRPQRRHMWFPLRLVRQQDMAIVAEGAPFYYCVGRLISHGQATPGSVLWFRRLLPSEESPEHALRRGEQLTERIAWTG